MTDTPSPEAGMAPVVDRQPAVKNLVKARIVVAIMATAAILSGNWPTAAMVAGCWLFTRRRKRRRCGCLLGQCESQAKPA